MRTSCKINYWPKFFGVALVRGGALGSRSGPSSPEHPITPTLTSLRTTNQSNGCPKAFFKQAMRGLCATMYDWIFF